MFGAKQMAKLDNDNSVPLLMRGHSSRPAAPRDTGKCQSGSEAKSEKEDQEEDEDDWNPQK